MTDEYPKCEDCGGVLWSDGLDNGCDMCGSCYGIEREFIETPQTLPDGGRPACPNCNRRQVTEYRHGTWLCDNPNCSVEVFVGG